MKYRHLLPLIWLVTAPATAFLQSFNASTVLSPSGGGTKDVLFNAVGAITPPILPPGMSVSSMPAPPYTSLFFILYGDGTFESGTGTAINPVHQYPAAGTYTATAFFAQKKHGSPPPSIAIPVTPGPLAGSAPALITNMPGTNIKLSTSWYPVPGQNHFIILTVANLNTSGTPQSGKIRFYYNSSQITLSPADFTLYNPHAPTSGPGIVPGVFLPSGLSLPGSGNYNAVLEYEYSNLAPGTKRNIFLYPQVLGGVSQGVLSYMTAHQITGQVKWYTHAPEITTALAAHDPNAKTVDVTDICAYTPSADLQYRVTFQNDGEAPVENVLVLDQLDILLKAGSVVFTGASHHCVFIPAPSGSHLIQFQFNNIKLPGINQKNPYQYTYNETVGSLTFQVPTESNLDPGIIPNAAEVYFDMPASMTMTDIAEVLIHENSEGEPCEVRDRGSASVKSGALQVSPNPFSDQLSIQVGHIRPGQSCLLEFFDALGKTMFHQIVITNTEINLNTHDFPAGLYYIRLKSNDGSEVRRVIKQ